MSHNLAMLEECRRLIASGDFHQAEACVNSYLKDNPDSLEAWQYLALCMLQMGRGHEAEIAIRRGLSSPPNSDVPYFNLGIALRLQNRGEEALEAFQTALAINPSHPPNFLQVFKQLQQTSRLDEAVAVLEAGVQKHPGSMVLAEALAIVYGRLKRTADAEKIFREIAKSSATAANSFATWLQEEGRFDEAMQVLQQSLTLQPIQGAPYRTLVEMGQFTLNGAPILHALVKLVADPRLDESSRMHMSYALGRLYERERDYAAAMRSFDKANEIAYRTYRICRTFDPVWTRREPELISEVYTDETMSDLTKMGNMDSRPIFIVGMIRSGTTLLDQIVSSHPDVISVGEGTFWNAESDAIYPRWARNRPTSGELSRLAGRYLNSVGVSENTGRFTDKMPLNYRNLAIIRSVFPNSRILHIKRDPFDTCLSIYTTFFAGGPNFAYSKENIVAFYRSYLLHMEHWRKALPSDVFFELEYEELVTNPATTIRKTLEFLGLPWDDLCLQHQANTDLVTTPSRWQARQPIYRTSLHKRKKYGTFAGAFLGL